MASRRSEVTVRYLEDIELILYLEPFNREIHYGSGAGFTRHVQQLNTDINLDPNPSKASAPKPSTLKASSSSNTPATSSSRCFSVNGVKTTGCRS
jgi:hypothetical protein